MERINNFNITFSYFRINFSARHLGSITTQSHNKCVVLFDAGVIKITPTALLFKYKQY